MQLHFNFGAISLIFSLIVNGYTLKRKDMRYVIITQAVTRNVRAIVTSLTPSFVFVLFVKTERVVINRSFTIGRLKLLCTGSAVTVADQKLKFLRIMSFARNLT